MNKEESTFQFTSLSVLIASVMISFIAIMMSLQHRFITKDTELYLPFNPTRYVVDDHFLVPTKAKIHYLTHSVITLIQHLESFLSFQLVYKEVTKRAEYIELSELLLNLTLIHDCENVSNYQTCVRNLQASTVYEYFNKLPNMKNSIATINECVSVKDCSNKNHLKLRFNDPSFARTVDDMKALLASKKRPLIMSVPEIYADYYIPCSDERVKDSKQCISKEIMCPSHITTSETYCGLISSPTHLDGGQFFMPASPAVARPEYPMVFNLVGYNNDFIPSGFPQQFSTLQLTKGAFIVKSLNGSGYGHTLDYLRGRISYQEDREICKNPTDVNNWKPCKNHECTEDNYLQANNDSPFDSNYFYSLVADNSQHSIPISYEDETGLTTTVLYKINQKTGAVLNKFSTSAIPYWRLPEVFTKVKDVKLNKDCSYWAVPYSYVELALSIEDASQASTLAVDLPVIYDTLPF